MKLIKDINDSIGYIRIMQITIGKENLYKFINKLVKDKSLSTSITEDVCTEIRSNNFSLIHNDTEVYNIAMEIFASCKNEQLMKLLSNINNENLHKLVKTAIIYNTSDEKYNISLKINTELSNELVGGSKIHYDYVEQIEQSEFLLRYVIVYIIYVVIERYDIEVDYKLIKYYYSETILSGLIFPSIISCEFDTNVEYSEFCSQFSRIKNTPNKLMVKAKTEYIPDFCNSKELHWKGFEDESKKSYINSSKIDDKGTLSINILDAKAITYRCYEDHNLSMQHKCVGISSNNNGAEIRITPILTDSHKIQVTMIFNNNLDFSRINLHNLSTAKNEVPRTNLYDCYDKILSPLYILSYIIKTVFDSNIVSISDEINIEEHAIFQFLQLYKHTQSSLDKAISAIMLSRLHYKQINKALDETYTPKNFRQIKEIKDMIKEYQEIKKSCKPIDLFRMFLLEITENR